MERFYGVDGMMFFPDFDVEMEVAVEHGTGIETYVNLIYEV